MKPDQLDALREHARLTLADTTKPRQAMSRKDYVAAVVGYALREFGASDEVRLHAERVARHLWDSSGR